MAPTYSLPRFITSTSIQTGFKLTNYKIYVTVATQALSAISHETNDKKLLGSCRFKTLTDALMLHSVNYNLALPMSVGGYASFAGLFLFVVRSKKSP